MLFYRANSACLPLLALLLTFLTATAHADTLLMNNGDKLSGVFLSESDGVLRFKTPYAGTLSIKWSEVSEIRTEKPMNLLLDEREVVSGPVLIKQDDKLILKNNQGEVVSALSEQGVEKINPDSWLLGKGSKISGMINISLQFDRGNNQNDEIDLDGRLEYRRLFHRLSLAGQYEEKSTDGITTKLKWQTYMAYDYFPRNEWDILVNAVDWYVGMSLNLKKDELADLNLRRQVGPHIGYQFFEGKQKNFLLQSGLVAVEEDYANGEANKYWASSWKVKFDKYLYKERMQIYFLSDGLYGYASPNKVVIENWLGLRFPLWSGFIASVEAETDYDSLPAESVKRFSTSYRLKLGYKF